MNQQRKVKNWFEWVVFTLGFLVVAGLVTYLVYDIWTARSGPPEIEVTLGDPKLHGDHYVIPVMLKNSGYGVAAQVQVEVTLSDNGQSEKANLVIQHLPRNATRSGAVAFAINPDGADRLEARVLGYEQP